MNAEYNPEDSEIIGTFDPSQYGVEEEIQEYDPTQSEIIGEATYLDELKSASRKISEKASGYAQKALDPGNLIRKIKENPDLQRAAYQIPGGVAKALTFPLDLWQMSGLLDQDELENLRKVHFREKGYALDEESLMQAQETAQATVPTQENIEELIEEKTGIQLTPKTRTDRLLRLFGSTAGFKPGSIGKKLVSGGTGAGISQGLVELGIPEQAADLVGMGVALSGIPEKMIPKTVKEMTGKVVDKGVGGFKSGIQRTGKAVEKFEESALEGFKRLSPEELEAKAISGDGPSPDLPPTSYETAGELLEIGKGKDIAAQEALKAQQPPESLGGIRPEATTERGAPLERGRVTRGAEDSGIRPIAQRPTRANLKDRVLYEIFPWDTPNTARVGEVLKNQLMSHDHRAYRNVNERYAISRVANEGVNQIHAQLVDEIIELTSDIREIPQPSGVQNQLLQAADEILDSLVVRMEDGTITGYREISNQVLIDQIQSLRQRIDFDFAHGQPKNIFRPLIREIQDSVVRVAQQSGNAQAANALLDANAAYREWTTTYNNKYINPYRDLSNRDFSKLYKSFNEIDNFVVIRDIIGNTAEGMEVIGVAQRDIAEKALKPYLEKPRNIDRSSFDRTLRELEITHAPSQIQSIRNEFRDRRVRKIKPSKDISKELQALEKFSKMTPENIQKKMDSRSGIQELTEQFTRPKEKKIFEQFKQEKIQEILRGGKVKAKYTGEDLQKVLNDRKNYNLMEELTSPEDTAKLLELSEEIGDRFFTLENAKDFGTKLMKWKFFRWLLLRS